MKFLRRDVVAKTSRPINDMDVLPFRPRINIFLRPSIKAAMPVSCCEAFAFFDPTWP